MNSSNFIYLIFELKIIQYPQIKLCLSGQNVSISWNYILLIWTKIGNQIIWETIFQKLLGITTDNNLKLDAHIELSCKKNWSEIKCTFTCKSLSLFQKMEHIDDVFIQAQLTYCPLICMLHSRRSNSFINHFHKRALRLGHNYKTCITTQLLLQILQLKNVESLKQSFPLKRPTTFWWKVSEIQLPWSN